MIDCPQCGEPAPGGTSWCEACGADLTDTPACIDCGAPGAEIDVDGYCGRCGHRQPSPRDHLEVELSHVAATSDKGRRHHENEDSFAIAEVADGAVAVVCDGVSSTPNSAQASQAAADAACAVLLDGATVQPESLNHALIEAAAAAQAAVVAVGVAPGAAAPPSCTFVAAVARRSATGTIVDVGWLGDSRAYWITDDQARLLTDDHAVGHSITRWLGADSPDIVPAVERFDLSTGRLIVCSDGLWSYATDPAELRELVDAVDGEALIDLSRRLVDHANANGGHDNITVAVVDV